MLDILNTLESTTFKHKQTFIWIHLSNLIQYMKWYGYIYTPQGTPNILNLVIYILINRKEANMSVTWIKWMWRYWKIIPSIHIPREDCVLNIHKINLHKYVYQAISIFWLKPRIGRMTLSTRWVLYAIIISSGN